MGIVWLVDKKRFLQEYHNHIRNIPLKYVNWLVDSKTEFVRMYIAAQGTNEVFCYIHKGGVETLGAMNDVIREEGMILGTVDLDGVTGMTEGLSDLTQEIKGIKFNQVTPL